MGGCFTGEDRFRLAGNGPIVVNKQTGVLAGLGSNKPFADLIAEYERQLG
jgi:hypothetical protein